MCSKEVNKSGLYAFFRAPSECQMPLNTQKTLYTPSQSLMKLCIDDRNDQQNKHRNNGYRYNPIRSHPSYQLAILRVLMSL